MAIRPTFYGFEMARSALAASQRNIDVTGQNIANINTQGYSRQRVNLSAVGAGGINWKYGLQAWENVGMGVNVDSIARIRDEFLDVRYWKESGDLSRYSIKADVLNQVEGLLDEITTQNVYSVLSDFENALQELNNNADDVEFASNVRMVAMTLTRTLNKVGIDITTIQNDQITRLNLVKDQVNQLSKALNDINLEIRNQYLTGVVSNELLDIRDSYIDQLSGMGNVRVVREESGGYSVYFGMGENDDTMLVSGNDSEYNTLEFDTDTTPYRLTWETGGNAGKEVIVNTGTIYAYYEMLNGNGDVSKVDDEADGSAKGIPYFMNMLDNFASSFADIFNDINGDPLFDSTDGGEITAMNIRISDEWRADPQFIVRSTSSDDTPGAARNDNVARFIEALKSENREMADGFVGSFQQYVASLNSEIAIEVSYNDKLLTVSEGLTLSIENLRLSVMGVSEDEEAMNLAKFQKSYNAAARYMTVLDEMLDTIVNRLGRAGL